MNTKLSNKNIEELKAQGQKYLRRVINHTQHFDATPDDVFPLLCPTAEFDWMEGWHCEMVYSKSLLQEYNAIFKTDYFIPGEVWVVSQFQPNRIIEFVRVSKNLSVKVDARICDNLDGTCTGNWIVNITALTEPGNVVLKNLKPEDEPIGILVDALAHYVENGAVKPLPDGIFNKRKSTVKTELLR